jgi:hypothetical protein
MATAATPKSPARRLTKEMKIMVVTELACFTAPSDVRDKVEKEFGYRIANLSTLGFYDPTTAQGEELGLKWRQLFEKTRATYLNDVGRVPVMNQAYRAHHLQRALEKEWARENTVGVRDTLKQAAEEEGGVFTNRRELTGAGGKDLPIAALTVTFVEPGKANGSG